MTVKDDTYSEAYRLECEARWVLSLPLNARRKYLARIQNLRGAEALRAEMLRQWNNTPNRKKKR